MEAVTVDTNILPIDDLQAIAESSGYALQIISVTYRELAITDLLEQASSLPRVPESAMFGESFWGAHFGGVEDAEIFEDVLRIISSGSFPPPEKRENLTPPQVNQLRDALILQAHIRTGNKVFVTGDAKAYVNHGRRSIFEDKYGVTIFSRVEFKDHCLTKGSLAH
ncbi:hypothetical protein [Pseudomonas kurunegalensis]|uniref:hypothetical protein n=1 Tax=Pseudomonas kurunegalensis TaxID=485880 RepID=UPI00257124D0|nr:hypothetical protein [Pseudomonas kurunegalensis]WJD61302.1 hypothetical protein QQ992_20480 [Pseudomonas kurunegalensis]